MEIVLALLALQGFLGAFDTLYFHEYKGKLTALVPTTTAELRLHVVRDLVYVIIFATLPVVAWQGAWVVVLVTLLVIEIVVTMADFIVEEWVRRPLGGVFPGERVTHALMGIVYGAMLGYLVPILREWWASPTGLVMSDVDVPITLALLVWAMGAGIFLSGVRDLYALLEFPHGSWPWQATSR
jgi:hypothetical protein